MLKPYVYLATGKSRDVQRDAPYGARVAVHFPEFGRSVELEVNAHGIWSVSERPAPAHGGAVNVIAQGDLADETPDGVLGEAEVQREAAANNTGEIVS